MASSSVPTPEMPVCAALRQHIQSVTLCSLCSPTSSLGILVTIHNVIAGHMNMWPHLVDRVGSHEHRADTAVVKHGQHTGEDAEGHHGRPLAHAAQHPRQGLRGAPPPPPPPSNTHSVPSPVLVLLCQRACACGYARITSKLPSPPPPPAAILRTQRGAFMAGACSSRAALHLQVLNDKYGVAQDSLRIFLHYQPS